ncbi:hypothetical protein FJT64_007653 [Amphibalanus amphitrite]|uniref:Uncharacterized protein n=1 Tax=Amphibalanus amphitrite TaxID=1232801 RepID=A0A6A4VZ06_AMPAM|nr:hypothetical protein FJT64_007653 [Amphibalanus amphitrite]
MRYASMNMKYLHFDDRSLSSCVRGLLAAGQPALQRFIDPLPLAAFSGSGALNWTLTGAQLHGLGAFEVPKLRIRHSAPLLLTIVFTLQWPQVTGTAAGWFATCPKVFDKPQCFSFTAKPRLRVMGASATLETHLHLSRRNGTLKVTPTRTHIGFDIEKLNVNVNLDGFLGVLDNMLRNPSDKVTSVDSVEPSESLV